VKKAEKQEKERRSAALKARNSFAKLVNDDHSLEQDTQLAKLEADLERLEGEIEKAAEKLREATVAHETALKSLSRTLEVRYSKAFVLSGRLHQILRTESKNRKEEAKNVEQRLNDAFKEDKDGKKLWGDQ